MVHGLLLAWVTDPWTYAIVAILALLFFGKRLPEVGRSLGKGIAEFKKGLRDVSDEMSREEPPPEPPRKELRPPQSTYDTAPRSLPPEPRASDLRPAPPQEPPATSVPGEPPRPGEAPGPGNGPAQP